LSSLNSQTIYIFTDSYWTAEPVLGELHVLDGTETVLHNAGYTSQFREINFWLLDPTDQWSNLEGVFKNGTTVVLVDWEGNSHNVKIRDLKISNHLTDIKRPTSSYVVARVQARLQKV